MSPDARATGAVAPAAPVVPGSVGILGGTFDPIHVGHLAIAEEVREALGLERILFVPALDPPHKPGVPLAPAETRARLVALAIAGNPAFALSRVELDRPGPSFAADTVALVAAAHGGRRPTFILSAEALAGLPAWHEPERLLAASRLAVVPRPGSAALDATWLAGRFPGAAIDAVFLDGPSLAVSATAIRARVAAGRSIRYLVPDAVAAAIAEDRLYRTA
ncbi:MAG: hypothetical protein RL338_1570 [Chloroflexota bacterium]